MHHDGMQRRDFLRGLGATGLGYTLCVRADAAAAATPPAPPDAADIVANIETLTPEDYRAAPQDPHLRRVALSCDVLVAGGGMAGVCAALAAARNGARVVLVQDRSRLGGNASSEFRMHIVGADHHGGRPGWREGGILEELRLENAATNPRFHWPIWDLLLYDKVVSEPGIRLLLDSVVCGATVADGRIVQALARCDKTEHLYEITATQFIDCTGDCRLGLEAGARFRTGHEGQDAFGESLAPPTGGPGTLGSSILFTSKDAFEPVAYKAPAWARKIRKEDLQFRGVRSWEYGYWWIEWGGQHSAIHDNERIRFELLSIVLGVWDYIKNSGDHPESATWAMDWIGMIPGKRSSRRLDGPHVLTEQDCRGLNGAFPDAVAIGGWPFDNHPPTGFDDPSVPPYESVKIDQVYGIPLRCLHSVNVANLFMAGRNISASHVAFTSTRVMGTCAVLGQAAGTAAAYCHRHGLAPGELGGDAAHLAAYRQTLLRDDQSIVGLKNADPLDLARQARVEASGAVEGSAPERVLSGETRDLPGAWAHRWGGPMAAEGAWIELQWDTPQTVGWVQITFDSGFHRELTLSESRGVQKRVIAGPQPELVCDYDLLARETPDGPLTPLLEVRENHLRLRRHAVAPRALHALRLQVRRTHGAPEARVFEVRCHAAPPDGVRVAGAD
jgi:hypothetical protein